MGTSDKIVVAVKFAKSEHITSLQKDGLIYMNTVNYFQKLENDKLRGDSQENLTCLLQPKQTILRINNNLIAAENFAGSIDVYNPENDKYNATHIFCLSCLSENDTVRDDYKIFDDRVKEFEGSDAMLIITDLQEINRRLQDALRELERNELITNPNYGRVKYLDFSSYHGGVDIFNKSNIFEYQKEWRLIVSALSNKDEPFQFKIGSIEDISVVLPLKDFKNKVTIDDDNQVILNF